MDESICWGEECRGVFRSDVLSDDKRKSEGMLGLCCYEQRDIVGCTGRRGYPATSGFPSESGAQRRGSGDVDEEDEVLG